MTSRPFVVLDMEWALQDKVEHIVSLAITRVVRGKRTTEGEYYQVLNPGVPIDAVTHGIHGFSDDDVKRKHAFSKVAQKVIDALSIEDAILVCHGVIDARVLGDHFTRLAEAGEPFSANDLPDLPVLDSSRLPRLVQHPAAAGKTSVSLPDLCAATGINLKNHHNARADARATADALVKLLRHTAAEATFGSIEDVIAAAGHGTVQAPRGALYVRGGNKAPSLPPAHLQSHAAAPLTHAATAEELALWLERARECVRLRCGLLASEVALAAPRNGAALRDPLSALFDGTLEPGQAGTAAGALEALLKASGPLAEAEATSPALPSSRATFWWRKMKDKVHGSPKCSTYLSQACPDCWEGDGCPRDRLYQQVTQSVVYVNGVDGLSKEFISSRLFSSGGAPKVLDRWAENHPREAAYAIELICEWCDRRGTSSAKYVSQARKFGIELKEPRLALRIVNQELPARGYEYARQLAEQALAEPTTDPAFQLLEGWLALQAAAEEERARRAKPKLIKRPRQARPAGRVPENPYRPF